jgi:hypothetical protein
MSNKEHAWWAVLIKGKRGNPKNKENRVEEATHEW